MNRWILSTKEFYTRMISYTSELGLPWHEHEAGPWRETLEEYRSDLAQIVGETREGSLLDPSCGWGRQAIALGEVGWRVTATHATEAYLVLARKRSAESGVSLELRSADMRSLDPAFSGRFDWVVCATPSTISATTRASARRCREMYCALKPGGACLIELRDMETPMQEQPRHEFQGEHPVPEGRVIIVEDWEFESDTHVISMCSSLREERRCDDYRRWTTTLAYRK